ncbi:MAG: hypothetical protein AAF702_24710 [Chloroflexota bacterium]
MTIDRILTTALALLMFVLSACAPIVLPADAASLDTGSSSGETSTFAEKYAASGSQADGTKVIEFDVAEDMNRFIFDKDVAYEDGMPADGSSFITRGFLYEVGTLDGTNGINPDGSPEFPDKVVGEWICQGYMINDAGHATGGVWVFSTQFFQFGDEPGAETLVTTGYELADIEIPIARAITGGSGEYSSARGESTQMLLGLNASEGVNLRVQVNVE